MKLPSNPCTGEAGVAKAAPRARAKTGKKSRRPDDGWWGQFVREHWEKAPARGTGEAISAAESFALCVRAAERYRTGSEEAEIYFYIDHLQVVAGVERWLPRKSDRTAEGYARRVGRLLEGRRFALVIQEAQVWSAPLWFALGAFLQKAGGYCDLRGRGAKSTLFLGNYPDTPFGLHRGDSNVFKFMVHGRKRLRLWADDFMRAHGVTPHSLRDDRYSAPASIYELRAGDLVYWPPECWHVGECVEGLAISLSLALFEQPRRTLYHDLLESAAGYVPAGAGGGDFAAMLARDSASIRRTVAHPEVIEEARARWLNRATSFGFRVAPEPAPRRPLDDDAWVCGDPHFPIVWLAGEGGELLCAANGHTFAVAAPPALGRLFERLNRGGWCHVGKMIKYHAREGLAGPEDIRAVLEKLCTLRALTIS